MKFIIPAIMLKMDEWNHIQLEYQAGKSTFGLKVNRDYFDDYTRMPILDLSNQRRFEIGIDFRSVVKK